MSVKNTLWTFILTPTGILPNTEYLARLHWRPKGSYSSDDPQQKNSEAQPLSSIGQAEKVLDVKL